MTDHIAIAVPKRFSADASAQPYRYWFLTALCGAILISGFFIAARQHFSSMDYAIKNSRLRKQLDDLESEKRRLLLAKEVAMTPSELLKAVKRNSVATPAQLAVAEVRVPKAVVPQGTDIVKKTVISKPAVPLAPVKPVQTAVSIKTAAKKTTSK
jgi:hypothetical protein